MIKLHDNSLLSTFIGTPPEVEGEVAWLQGMKRNLAIMTGLSLIALLASNFATGITGWIVSTLLALLLSGIALTIWVQLKHLNRGAAEEVLLREAFHSLLTPQVISDLTGQVILSNRAFQGWINLGSFNLYTALLQSFGNTPEVESELKQIQTNLANAQAIITDLPVTRNGRITEWRRILARPIEGESKYFYWRFEDISEKRRLERQMRDEQTKLLDFMAHAPVGIYSADQHGRFRFVNQTLAEWLQASPEELVRGEVKVHEVLNEPPKNIPAYALTTGTHGELRGEVSLRRRDGQIFPVAITQTIVKEEDGKTLRTRSIVRDLTPEREWQQALSLSEYRFQRLFAEAPIGIILLDPKLVIIESNHAFHTIAQRPRREAVVGQSFGDLIDATERPNTIKQLENVLAGTDLKKPLEVHISAGREVIANVFAKRFGVAGGLEPAGQKGLMLYFIDATEQKRLEVQFAQSQKMQAIGQLAGGVAHDFNNLLTAMIGFCDLLLQRHKPGDQSFSDIMQIKQNGNRAANLVRQLLAFSRQQTLQPKVLNLVDVLSELTNLLRRLIGAQIKLEMVHGRDLGLVKVDQGQLEQVIINLVVNARDAMPNGGTVTIKTQNVNQKDHIIRGQEEMPAGDYICIEVSDTGVGIPRENLQRIFEPFFSTKEVGSGTGLGLSTVYGIVRQTGGFVDVKSHVGKGSSFTVYIPAFIESATQEPTPTEELREEKPGPDLTGVGTILLVEDEDAVRVFSARALRNKGYVIFEARSGEEAMAVLEKEGEHIDLTITDVVMPQMDGPTLFKHIREKWPKMNVIFMSGYTEDRLREQFKSGETIHFLGKPFTLKQLAGKVKEVFEIET